MKLPQISETIRQRVREVARERCGCCNWNENFRWSGDGVKIEGITPVGRATTEALKLNNELAVEVRQKLGTGRMASAG